MRIKISRRINEYQRQRVNEYPPYVDQFDKIYHSGVNAWKTQIRAVKKIQTNYGSDELKNRQDKAIEDLNNK